MPAAWSAKGRVSRGLSAQPLAHTQPKRWLVGAGSLPKGMRTTPVQAPGFSGPFCTSSALSCSQPSLLECGLHVPAPCPVPPPLPDSREQPKAQRLPRAGRREVRARSRSFISSAVSTATDQAAEPSFAGTGSIPAAGLEHTAQSSSLQGEREQSGCPSAPRAVLVGSQLG